ncbi:modulatory calcineurin-interacting protein [Cavenderia fasciculata]|uniref:Modulatory calcineurin-interacting protein n=1 Tax=Cavenderia fasciculata TaxID=261658 RepID=F4PYW6_CACFS|nr:modulatory calcineurin-interacting protein [Cavenderia fasciculata]EGG18995.1 modulatory calcineurin-interacting protein [Cavenderia fasciculata]|eukprot:XP_004357474.1 modulatory calcineurin-interacting protein [Cavenderia fasciculata]
MQSLNDQLEQLIIENNDIENQPPEQQNKDTNSTAVGTTTTTSAKEMNHIIRQKKIQLLLKREPTNVLILENIDQQTGFNVQTLIEEYLEQSCLTPLVLARYISILNSLIFVFAHRNDAHLSKLLIERQPIIKKSFNLYFGKELSESIIRKHQLLPPFATRQFLISPPLSPPEEWETPGDGLEEGPEDGIENHPSSFSGFDPQQLNSRLQLVYQDQTNNNFPSISVEFCT